ncbi:MAG: hypothetical protein KDE58_31205 [Caldilineaceae bacterium]|nr:hypothetical protein [Caldilineaceae bacterium]
MKLYTAAIGIALVLALSAVPVFATSSDACWGQATAVFAQTGEMGEHASQEPTPRLGLHNLARALYEAGIIADDSMAALGQFVASSMGLNIDACTD